MHSDHPEVRPHKNKHVAERFEGMLGTLMVVAIVVLAIASIIGGRFMEVRELTDGTWLVTFEDRYPDTRFPGFEISIQQDWSPEQAVRELRLELRHKLWICPLCQRRSQIRRVVDRDGVPGLAGRLPIVR